VTLWHLGALHAYEQALVLILAFGPFVVLGIVVWLRSREGRLEDRTEHDEAPGGPPVS